MKGAVVAFAAMGLMSNAALAQDSSGAKFLAFAFADDRHGWVAGSGGIDVTQDGGRSWKPQFRGRRVDELVIVRRRSLFALADGAVLHTTDDGATWQIAAQPRPALVHIAFASERAGFAIGTDRLLYVTADGAKTWRRASFNRPLSAVCFSDRQTGFVSGAVTAPAPGAFDGIAATRDGGRTWAQTTRPPTDGQTGIAGHTLHCTRSSVYDLVDLGGHAGGGAYVLARSTDAGRSWKPIATGGQAPSLPHVAKGPGSEATSMTAYSRRAASIAGFCGPCGAGGQSSFGATTNAGRSWKNVTLGALVVTSAPVFTSGRHGWIGVRTLIDGRAVGDEILMTDNAGQTWTIIFKAANTPH
jgi:photosystem II stability/assembly factor-like uncharacterized protein